MTGISTPMAWVRPPRKTQVHHDRWQGGMPENVLEAQARLVWDPYSADLFIALGRELSRAGLFREAIDVYSRAIALDPSNYLLFRHRGHRYISTMRYPEAVADLKWAAALKDDHWDTLYHLGLAYYLSGDFDLAAQAYCDCLSVTDAEEHLPAVVDWYYLTLMRLGCREEAMAVAQLVGPETEAGENEPYKQRILVYRGLKTAEELLESLPAGDDHMYCTGAFGIAMEYYFRGQGDKARELLAEITSRQAAWYGFASLAAVEEEKRLRF